MTEEELQSHIQPFLRYAINGLERDKTIGIALNLCEYANQYASDEVGDITFSVLYPYLANWLDINRPHDSYFINKGGVLSIYWWGDKSLITPEGIQKRIDFCKQHLIES